MPINFTDSPSNGATQTIGGRTYTYNSAKNKWDTTATEVTGPTATVYASVDNLPTSGNITGSQAFVSGTNRLYIWNGSGWYNIALINNTPTISGASAAYSLAIDGTATTVTLTATDPEGLPITYSIASDTSGNTATVTQGTGSNTNVFTITPSTNSAHQGTFSLTFRASDGVNLATAVSSFTLQFQVQNSRYTTALITSVGANNAVNNSFDDKSTLDHTITANGNIRQTTFSPYRPGGYAEHFTNDRISYANHSSMQIGTQDFCMEAWIKLRTQGVNFERFITQQASWAQGGVKGVEFATEQTGTPQLNIMIDGSSSTDFGYAHNIDKERWYHAVITRENGHARIFIDGVLENNAANTTNINGSGGTHFGTNTAGTDQMDDFFIRDFRLCIGGVPTDYSTTSTTNDATIFTPPTAHITKTSQGATASEVKALLFNTPYLQDNSDNTNASITLHSKGVTIPDGPYDTLEYSAADHSGSMHLDGTGDYLTIADHADLDFGSSDWTIEGWYYPHVTPASSTAALFSKRANAYATDGVLLYFAGSNTNPSLLVDNGSNWTPQVASSIGFTVKAWNHFAATKSGNDYKFFINGKQGISTTAATTTPDNTAAFAIGCMSADGNLPIPESNIADFRVVKGTAVYTAEFTPPTAPLTAITNTKLLVQSTDAGIIDKSQSISTLTLQNGSKSSTAQTKYLSSSIDFTTDLAEIYVQQDAAFFAGDFTIEAWIWSANIDNGGTNNMAIFDWRPTSTNGNYVLLWVYASSSTPGYYVNGAYRIIGNTTLSDSTWHHVAVSREGSTHRMFIDGTLQTQTWTDSGTYLMPANRPIIGNSGYHRTDTNFDFNGYMSDVRLTKGLARYTANFTPPSAALSG